MAASFSINARQVQTARGAISYLESGHGPVLMLLHGIGSSARSWQAQLQTLASQFHVIAWNAPGYGASTHLPDDAPSVSEYATSLRALLDALNITRMHLLGHSLGALIAGRFAALHPELVQSLQLASCAIGHAQYEPARRATLLQSRLDDVTQLGIDGMAQKRGPNLLTNAAPPAMRTSVVDTMAGLDPHGYAQAARMLSGGDLIADIAALEPRIPLHVLYGAQDTITPPQVNMEAAAARAGTEVTQIPQAGHAVYIEQADLFSRAASLFAARHTTEIQT